MMTDTIDSAGQHDLVFFANRNTPLVVPKGGSIDGKVKKGYGAQTSRRAAKPEEEKVIAGGGWLQVNNKGKKPGQSGYSPGSNYRPQLRDKSEQLPGLRDVDILLIDEIVNDSASVPSVQTGPNQIYAAIRSDSVKDAGGSSANAPVYRKVIKIERDGNGKTVSTVVQDYKLDKALNSIIDDAMLDVAEELADADDTPEEQRLLMSAWQALAMYLASCDDEDRNAAATALKVVSDLMAGTGSTTSPLPDGTFGKTTQTAAATTTYSCAKCPRAFSTMGGLISHLQNVHDMDNSSAKKFAAKQGESK